MNGPGHGEKRSRKQEQAIIALLEEPTITAAAHRLEIGEATMWRWLQEPDFQAAYRQARSQLLHQTLDDLRKAGRQAVDTLLRNTTCGTPSVEVKAASELLSWLFKATELQDFEERLAQLEAGHAA